jgi:hypothetical protein
MLIFCTVVAAFVGLQKLGQNEEIYRQTFAHISLNYQRTGDWLDYTITKDSIPYLPVSEDNLSNWDAAIYHCLKQYGYAQEVNCYDSFKASFFPGFPIFWQLTGLGFRAISLVNYGLFAVSILIILSHFRLKPLEKFGFFILILVSPSAIIFALPYSEALFAFSGVLALHAYLRHNKKLFFAAFYLMLLTRVAGLFILIAVLMVALVHLLSNKEKSLKSLWQSYGFLAALASGLAITTYLTLIYAQQGSLGAYFEATQIQEAFFKWPWPLQDWSLESFGLSSFTIGAVLIPSLVFSLVFLYNQARLRRALTAKEKIFAVAVLYWSGILVFELLHSGGIIHSLHRFVFCSPVFLFAAAYAYTHKPSVFLYLAFAGLALAIILWQTNVYGGYVWRNELLGMLLWPFMFLMLYASRALKDKWRWVLAPFLLVFLWWNTYLLNQILSNAWIFT